MWVPALHHLVYERLSTAALTTNFFLKLVWLRMNEPQKDINISSIMSPCSSKEFARSCIKMGITFEVLLRLYSLGLIRGIIYWLAAIAEAQPLATLWQSTEPFPTVFTKCLIYIKMLHKTSSPLTLRRIVCWEQLAQRRDHLLIVQARRYSKYVISGLKKCRSYSA